MDGLEIGNLNQDQIDERVMEFLKKDVAVLLKGLEGKKLNEIDFELVTDYLENLKFEVNRLKDGSRARDDFMPYLSETDITSMFEKEKAPKTR